jgi:TPR repeat protein
MAKKQSENSKRNYRTSHLSKDEKELAEVLYKIGIDFNACTPSEAVEWHREVAKKGWAPAQYNLGCCYKDGIGVDKDPKEAVKWFNKAAEQGLREAQCRLGGCYEKGEGVKQDKKEAVNWYRKAAGLNEANAQFNLGCCYAEGEGVQQDKLKAAKWFYEAAKRGNKSAKDALRHLLDNVDDDDEGETVQV